VEAEIVDACRRLAARPLIGHHRRHITSLLVRFWTVPKYSNYVIVYRAETTPLRVIAILYGNRDLEQVLKDRLLGE
jgi:plasmid stabilization system protein ParE